jgi:hypothetical protein
VEVDLGIHENVMCTKVDLESDDERKIPTSFPQRTTYIVHLTHSLGKYILCRLIGHVLQETHVIEF